MRPRKWSGLDTHADPETSRARQGAGGRSPADARHRLPGRPTPSGEERRGARPRPLKTPEHRLSPQRRSTVRKRGLYFRASLKEGGAGWVLLACGGRRDLLHRRRQVALTGQLGAGLLGLGGGRQARWEGELGAGLLGLGVGRQACCCGGPGPHPPGTPRARTRASRRDPGPWPPALSRRACRLSTSPAPAGSSAAFWVWAGASPRSFSGSAFSLRGRSAEDPGGPPGGPGAGGAPPSREPALGTGLGPSPPPRPSHPPIAARAAGASGCASSRRSTSSSRASACLSGGGRGVVGGAGAPTGRPGPAPAPGPSPTFEEQLLLAALKGTDLPGQSPLQHLLGERGALSLQLSWSSPPPRLSESPYLN